VVDEPMVGLDPKSARLLKNLFRQFVDRGGTVLMSTHTLEVAQAGGSDRHRPLLVLLTDGRATSAPDGLDPVAAAHQAAARVRQRRVSAVVVDAEDGPTRLGLASELAGIMGARHLTLAELEAGVLAHEITAAADGGWTPTTS
jgi:Mg-chelatase subunit ChlD